MKYLEAYLKRLEAGGKQDLAEGVRRTADAFARNFIRGFSFGESRTGLLLGNVQSGKTSHMFGVVGAAADEGFCIFLILTVDNNALYSQTLTRVRRDLPEFEVCGETDGRAFEANRLRKPAIVVLKKNGRILRLWCDNLRSSGLLPGNPLFVIDDEGDAASLNTLINRGGQSTINRQLDLIARECSSSLYLQVTGTPQALLLQAVESAWHPDYVHYFEPGAGYLGGNCVFPGDAVPSCVEFVDDLENPVRSALVHHLAASAQIFASGGTVSNFVAHPGVRQREHEALVHVLGKELGWCRDNVRGEFRDWLERAHGELAPTASVLLPFDRVYEGAVSLLGSVRVVVMNAKNEVDNEEFADGCNVVVGGNTLGRGITFPALHTIYYTRTSKNPQADTMWQHSRMFGYDRDIGMMKLYIDRRLYKIFSDINTTNNSIIAQAERGFDNIRIVQSASLRPTRSNVIDKKKVIVITGGTNYFPFDPDNDTIEDIDRLLDCFDDNIPSHQASLRLMLEIFRHIHSGDDFSVATFAGILEAMLAENPGAQGRLIVRRERDIAHGTGAMLSPNDWELGATFDDLPVLTLYKVTGRKGWGGRKLWIPNIKLPCNAVYYNVEKG